MRLLLRQPGRTQRGATAVEFALVALMFLTVVLGILEFGRLFYVNATVQEVTRRAAREQVVRWVTAANAVKRGAVFGPTSGSGTVSLPAGSEVTNDTVVITFHHSLSDAMSGSGAITPTGADPVENVNQCLAASTSCIRFVRAVLQTSNSNGDVQPVRYEPMVGLFSFLDVPLPGATVVMPAESLGLP